MKLLTSFLLLGALGLLGLTSAAAQEPKPPDHFDPEQIDSYLASEALRKGRVGLSVAIMKDGNLALAKGYGQASAEGNVPAGVETLDAKADHPGSADRAVRGR